jgi:hypothetical protein
LLCRYRKIKIVAGGAEFADKCLEGGRFAAASAIPPTIRSSIIPLYLHLTPRRALFSFSRTIICKICGYGPCFRCAFTGISLLRHGCLLFRRRRDRSARASRPFEEQAAAVMKSAVHQYLQGLAT